MEERVDLRGHASRKGRKGEKKRKFTSRELSGGWGGGRGKLLTYGWKQDAGEDVVVGSSLWGEPGGVAGPVREGVGFRGRSFV